MVGIARGFVRHAQLWLVYNGFCLSWTIMVGFNTPFCLSSTKMVGITPSFVCLGYYWLVYQQVLSVLDNNG